MSCYTIVYLLSSFIDKHIASLDKAKFVKALIASYLFLYLWHWIIGKTGGLPLGQPMLMITIYIIGRYCNKYGMPKLISNHPVGVYILTLLLIIGIIAILLSQHVIPQSLIWFVYTNGSPFVILASIAFFELFRRKTWHSKFVNYLSGSVLAIYLITDSPYVRGHFNQWLYANYEFNFAVYMVMVVLTMLLCLLADQIRRILFNKIYSLIESVLK